MIRTDKLRSLIAKIRRGLHLLSAVVYIIGAFLLYPLFYVYFDGVAWFSYCFIFASLALLINCVLDLV